MVWFDVSTGIPSVCSIVAIDLNVGRSVASSTMAWAQVASKPRHERKQTILGHSRHVTHFDDIDLTSSTIS